VGVFQAKRIRRIGLPLVAALVAVLSCGGAALGATIDVGYHALLPNTSGQQIDILVAGGENVAGVDLFAQVGDGGPELVNVGLPAGTDGPELASADLLSGTIFAGTSAIQVDQDRAGVVQVLAAGAALSDPPPAPQTVPAMGRLVTLTIDTTGFFSGTFDLALAGVLPSLDGGPFDTTLVGSGGTPIAASITNGTIEVTVTRNGDYNLNGVVDAADYSVWRDSLGQSGPGLAADGDGNHVIEENDFLVWRNAFGTLTGSPGTGAGISRAVVPEPATILGFPLTILWLLLYRRTRSSNRLR